MTLGFIGCGKMANALVEGVLRSGAFSAGEIVVSDVYAPAIEQLCARAGVKGLKTNAEVAAAADVIVLCVKPNDAAAALEAARDEAAGKLIVSIMAGVPLSRLQSMAGEKARVVRVMPNTPALVHRGAAAYAMGDGATPEDAAIVEKMLSAVGTVAAVKESLLDAVTGLSGSGPAYVYLMIEALSDGGVLAGLPRHLATQLAAQTVAGAAEMVLRTGEHPAALKDMVTSPGGTTIAGIEALEHGGVRAALMEAVRAAAERSRELGSGNG